MEKMESMEIPDHSMEDVYKTYSSLPILRVEQVGRVHAVWVCDPSQGSDGHGDLPKAILGTCHQSPGPYETGWKGGERTPKHRRVVTTVTAMPTSASPTALAFQIKRRIVSIIVRRQKAADTLRWTRRFESAVSRCWAVLPRSCENPDSFDWAMRNLSRLTRLAQHKKAGEGGRIRLSSAGMAGYNYQVTTKDLGVQMSPIPKSCSYVRAQSA